MATIKHNFVSPKIDSSDVDIVQPSNWNEQHKFEPPIIGLVTDKLGDGNLTGIRVTGLLKDDGAGNIIGVQVTGLLHDKLGDGNITGVRVQGLLYDAAGDGTITGLHVTGILQDKDGTGAITPVRVQGLLYDQTGNGNISGLHVTGLLNDKNGTGVITGVRVTGLLFDKLGDGNITGVNVTGVLVKDAASGNFVGITASAEGQYLRRAVTGGAVTYEFGTLPASGGGGSFTPNVQGLLLDKTGANLFTGVNVTGFPCNPAGDNNYVGISTTTPNLYLRSKSGGYEFGTIPPIPFDPETWAQDYQFTIAPTNSIAAGANQVMNFASLPLGINSNSPNHHYIAIADGANSEIVLITAVTSTSITVTTTLAHTLGNYYLNSATMGIQEAIFATSVVTVNCFGKQSSTGTVATWNISGMIFLPLGFSLIFSYGTAIYRAFGGTNPLIKTYGSGVGGGIFNLYTGNHGSIPINPAAFNIEINNGVHFIVENVICSSTGSGIKMNSSQHVIIHNFCLDYFQGVGIEAHYTGFTCNQYSARTNDNGAVFYKPGTGNTTGQFDTFMWQGGPTQSPNTIGIDVQNGNNFAEHIFVNGIVDSCPVFLNYQSGAVASYNNKFANIGMFGGQLQGSATVNINTTTVTWVSGTNFTGLSAGMAFNYAGTTYNILVVNSSTVLTLSTSAGVANGVAATFGGNMVFCLLRPIVQNIVFDNIDLYGAGHPGGIIQILGGDNICFSGFRVNGSVQIPGGSRGFEISGRVRDLSLINCSIGYNAGVADSNIAHAVVINNYAHERILVSDCRLYGTITKFGNLGPSGALNFGYNYGISDVIGAVTAAATITIGPNPIQSVSGQAVITNILGGWPGREVSFVFTDSTPGGFGVGSGSGAILKARTVVQNTMIKLLTNGPNWY